ncbi:hypothetical protein K7957_07430 [Sphingomonas yunnanensis]|uniref:hypothetical protein n=1 Tax=Sphingomonas yunnanensis TaxID=310400 RepID=UPI001CA6C48C|nr:hypothetical protein [Sphingomonas yunnanensis]MBY9062760.1 hypothetical protein [Sphingomonas yunnanensis]
MRPTTSPLLLLPLLLPAPATAQRTGPIAPTPRTDSGETPDLPTTRDSIARERRAGRLSRRDARRARAETDVNAAIAARYASGGGLSDSVRTEIDGRDHATRSLLDGPAQRQPRH